MSWRLRSRELAARYQNATAALKQAHYADALIWLTAIVEEDAGYRDVAELFEATYRGRRDQAAAAHREGIGLEQADNLRGAVLAFGRALAVDPEFKEAADRLAAVQRTINDRVGRALRQAAIEEAFGLTGDASVVYGEVTRLLPRTATERIRAERRLEALAASRQPPLLGAASAPSVMRLDPISSEESLQFVNDPGGRFIARLPRRRWQLTRGSGQTIAIVTEKDGRGSILVDAVRLGQSVSLDSDYELVMSIESRLIAKREPGAGPVLHRRVSPALPMIILDYRRPGPGGEMRRVRQFSIVRGRTLYRITAMNALAPFHEVEGVFNDFARSFQPLGHEPKPRP